METFLVIAIVGAAAAYTARNLYKKFKGDTGCSGCSSGGCDNTSQCCCPSQNDTNIIK